MNYYDQDDKTVSSPPPSWLSYHLGFYCEFGWNKQIFWDNSWIDFYTVTCSSLSLNYMCLSHWVISRHRFQVLNHVWVKELINLVVLPSCLSLSLLTWWNIFTLIDGYNPSVSGCLKLFSLMLSLVYANLHSSTHSTTESRSKNCFGKC